MGPKSYLTDEEEKCLVAWVKLMAKTGFPVGKKQLLESAQRILNEVPRQDNREIPFSNNTPGRTCYKCFMHRHPDITSRTPQNLKLSLTILLFIDGHAFHLTLHTSKFCSENGIILVALYPNATHLIQPMDISVFRTLKSVWKDCVHEWRLKNVQNPILNKHHFCLLLKSVLEQRLNNTEVIQNGFCKAGLYPWNLKFVQSLLLDAESNKTKDETNQLKILEAGIHCMDKYLTNDKKDLFRTKENWDGNKKDVSLFNLYKNILRDIDSLKNRDGNLTKPPKLPDSEASASSSKFAKLKQIKNEKSPEHNKENMNTNILPSPFKHILTWPEEIIKTRQGQRKKIKVPAVTSGREWQLFHENKMNLKKKQEEEK